MREIELSAGSIEYEDTGGHTSAVAYDWLQKVFAKRYPFCREGSDMNKASIGGKPMGPRNEE